VIPEPAPEKTAPEPLRLVQRFVNSTEIHESRPTDEELVSPEALRDWFAERELMDPSEAVTEADLARARDVREGLRALLMAHNGEPLDRKLVDRLDRVARQVQVHVCFGEDAEPELVAESSGVDGALARLLAIVATAAEQGTWERLKACPRDCCMWAFYDRSKNRSGRWCSMDTCGNVEKARAFRERQRTHA
jgi:predicted RNA-binding Zn ribbon-like protein